MERDDRPNVAYSQSIQVEKRRTFSEAFSVPLSLEELRHPTRKWQETTLGRRVASDEHRASAYVLDGPNPSLPLRMLGGKVTVEKKEDVPFMDFIQKVVTDTVVKAVDKAKGEASSDVKDLSDAHRIPMSRKQIVFSMHPRPWSFVP